MKRYTYQCRLCPPHIRARCIREANLSPAVKLIIARAFDSKTDTEDTWDTLQRDCLLVRLGEVPVVSPTGTGPRKGGLWERLHLKDGTSSESETTTQQPELPVVGPPGGQHGPTWSSEGVPQARAAVGKTTQTGGLANVPVSANTGNLASFSAIRAPPTPATRPVTGQLAYPEVIPPRLVANGTSGPCMLVALAGGHRIFLPEEGELVLGRFDPLTGVRPDVDLSFEDQTSMTVSRRHARILGWYGRYAVEDLGSSNGTWINNKRLETGQKHPLKIGDVLRLGRCILFVNEWPEIWQAPAPNGRYFLYATFTGHFFPLQVQGENLIGRADADLGFYPNVDLAGEPGCEMVVSRRHARLFAQRGQFVVQDLGSTHGTRVDGQQLALGIQMPIHPGQHLWLGGYTLAFDVI